MATFVLESTWTEDWDGAGAGESWSDEEAENALTWLSNIGSGAASGAATGAVAGPWGALIGGLVGGGLGAAQTALQQNQQNQQPKPAPTAPQRPAAPSPPPVARPAPAPAPTPRPAPAPSRTIAVPRPAPSRPAPTTPAAPGGSVSPSDVAALVTTLAPMLLALGQQLASTPSDPAAAAPEAWPDWPEDADPWPVGEDVEPTEPLEAPPSVETYAEPLPSTHADSQELDELAGHESSGTWESVDADVGAESEAASGSESETECWPAEGEWQEVPA